MGLRGAEEGVDEAEQILSMVGNPPRLLHTATFPTREEIVDQVGLLAPQAVNSGRRVHGRPSAISDYYRLIVKDRKEYGPPL